MDRWNKAEDPNVCMCIIPHLTKIPKLHNEWKDSIFNKCAGEAGCPHVKNSNKTHSLLPCPTTITEIHKCLKYKIHNCCIDNATLAPKAQEQSLRWGGKICRNQRTKMSAAEVSSRLNREATPLSLNSIAVRTRLAQWQHQLMCGHESGNSDQVLPPGEESQANHKRHSHG